MPSFSRSRQTLITPTWQCGTSPAGVAHRVEARIGTATESLKRMAEGNEAPFDLIFIDADKVSYPDYLKLSLPLLRDGGLLLGDNTLRGVLGREDSGKVRCSAAVAETPELTSVVIPVLRQRGIDGLTVSLERSI